MSAAPLQPPAGEDPERHGYAALVSLGCLLVFGGVGFAAGGASQPPRTRSIHVVAHQYGYEPQVIHVNRGDTVRLTFSSSDVTHGFYLEGYDLDVTIHPLLPTVDLRHPSQPGKVEQVKEVTFTASREGKFRFRCSHTCGFLHPFMLGELIVGPNRLLPASMGMLLGLVLGGLLGLAIQGRRSKA